MKYKHFFVMMIVVVNPSVYADLADVLFDTSTTVGAADGYARVTMTSPAGDTVVDYYGWGELFDTYDNSVLNIYEGSSFFYDGGYSSMHDTSVVNLYEGGFLGITSMTLLELMDSSILNIRGGNVSIMITARQSTTINLFAGTLAYDPSLYDNSIMNVYGGTLTGYTGDHVIEIDPAATLNFYGYDFVYDADGDDEGVGKITGFDLAGNPVTYYGIPDPANHPNIHFIPEPVTLSLMALGSLILIRKKVRNLYA